MLAFRSEGHLRRWLENRGLERGATLTIAQTWRLAVEYYAHKADPGWRRKTPGESQALFDELGLRGPFWDLTR
jgi:hypothetical protein